MKFIYWCVLFIPGLVVLLYVKMWRFFSMVLQTNFRLSQKKLPYQKIKAIFSKIPYFQQFWKLQTKNTLHENYKNMYKNTCFYTGQNLNIVNDYHWQDSTIVLHKNIYIYIFKIIVSKFEFSKCTFYFIRLVLCSC